MVKPCLASLVRLAVASLRAIVRTPRSRLKDMRSFPSSTNLSNPTAGPRRSECDPLFHYYVIVNRVSGKATRQFCTIDERHAGPHDPEHVCLASPRAVSHTPIR
jgi:hypothetical protein